MHLRWIRHHRNGVFRSHGNRRRIGQVAIGSRSPRCHRGRVRRVGRVERVSRVSRGLDGRAMNRGPSSQLYTAVSSLWFPCRRYILGASPLGRKLGLGRSDGRTRFQRIVPERAPGRRRYGRVGISGQRSLHGVVGAPSSHSARPGRIHRQALASGIWMGGPRPPMAINCRRGR